MDHLLPRIRDKAKRLLAEAADLGSQLVVFPEAFIGGYPRGSSFELAIGARTAKGRDDFRKYLAFAIDVPGDRAYDIVPFCNEYAVPKDKIDHFKPVTAKDIICSQKHTSLTLKEEDIARGRENPLECIKFFKDYESEEKFVIPEERVSHLLPTTYQDMIMRVYAKKPELVEAVSEAFENFQMRTYGIKAQVHATPEKKKRHVMM
ncbi:hypothetical protein AALP_AAs68427U000200 [Arabis alpina]|uniref:CN hydrolase domain-containing protein n=1 Tax=Arabis alpina TaxID=50452 RepID=A0A087G1G5_ARAAL|nr:hypothetical protein AALP_AAs68427U000200 [Arabis alpina]